MRSAHAQLHGAADARHVVAVVGAGEHAERASAAQPHALAIARGGRGAVLGDGARDRHPGVALETLDRDLRAVVRGGHPPGEAHDRAARRAPHALGATDTFGATPTDTIGLA